MKKSLELLRDKLLGQGWTKEANRVNTLVKWANVIPKKGRYGVLDNTVTVDYNPSSPSSILVHSSSNPKYKVGDTYYQGSDEAFDLLFSLVKKKVEKTP
jgi:hypothetical protein